MSADFALGADGLVIDGFDPAAEAISISRVEDQYRFTLSEGIWSNVGQTAAGVAVNGATLSVDAVALGPLSAGIRVVATADADLAVTFDGGDFGDLSGPISIDGATSIGQSSGPAITGPVGSVLAITAPAAGLELDSFDLERDLLLEFNGPITDLPGTEIRVTGNATFISRPSAGGPFDLNGNSIVDSGDISVWSAAFGNDAGGDVNNDGATTAADYTVLRDLVSASVDADAAGITLADTADDSLIVTGVATFVAQSADAAARFDISVGAGAGTSQTGATVEFGAVSAFGAAATIYESNDTVLSDSNVDSLTVISAGSITDTGTTDVAVAGAASFNSLPDALIALDDIHDFGTLTFDGGDVTIVEQSGTELVGLNEADANLTLRSAGPITDDDTAAIGVGGNASFTSTIGDDILLDSPLGHGFGSLTFSGANVVILEEGFSPALPSSVTGGVLASVAPTPGVLLSGQSLALTLSLAGNGPITDDGTADVTVIGNAFFDSLDDGPIILAGDTADPADNDTYNFGTLAFDGGDVEIDEASGSILSGATFLDPMREINAASLFLRSAGSIQDDIISDLNITGDAFFTAGSAGNRFDISLDTFDNQFGSLGFSGAAVFINEFDDIDLSGASEATSLFLASGNGIRDSADAALTVDSLAAFTAVEDIELDADTLDFGSLAFAAENVSISETSDTVFAGGSFVSGDLTLTAAGTITDDNTLPTSLFVTGLASFTADSSVPENITLNNASHTFGRLAFIGDEVEILENDDTLLSGVSSAAGGLALTSLGDIAGDGTADLTVAGLAEFQAATGGGITLTEAEGLFDYGTLRFSGGGVEIVDSSDVALSGMSTADTLSLTAATGSIEDQAGALLSVLGNATFVAADDSAITLGDNATLNTGTVTFNGGAVDLNEASGVALAGLSEADTLTLSADGDITDTAGSDLDVAALADLTAAGGGNVLLDETVNFGSLVFEGGTVAVFEDSDTLLAGASLAESLNLVSAGAIDAPNAQVTIVGNARFEAAGGGDVTLAEASDLNFGSLTLVGGEVVVFEDSPTLLAGVSNVASLALTSNGPITDDEAAVVSVAGNAAFDSGSNPLTLTEPSTLNFGSLTFQATAVSISEDSSTELAGDNDATTLTLQSLGDITDAPGAELDVTGAAQLVTLPIGAIALDETVRLGSLTFTGGDVAVTESDDSLIVGVNEAASLALASLGEITDDGTATVTVGGNARFDAGANPITLTESSTLNFGSLTFVGAVVNIFEDSSTLLAGDSLAEELTLTTAGDLADAATATLQVTNPGGGATTVLTAAGSIALADADTEDNLLFINSAVIFDINTGLSVGAVLGTTVNAAAQALVLGPISVQGAGPPGVIILDPFAPPAPAFQAVSSPGLAAADEAFADHTVDGFDIEPLDTEPLDAGDLFDLLVDEELAA